MMEEKLKIPDKTIPQLLKEQAEKYGDKTALIYFGKKISYAKLYENAKKIAGYLHIVTKPGDRVAIWMPNMPQTVYIYYGVLMAGCVAVPINFTSLVPALKSGKKMEDIAITKDVEFQIMDAQPKVLFMADFFYPLYRQLHHNINWPYCVSVTSPADHLPFPLNCLYPIKAKKEGKSVKIDKNDRGVDYSVKEVLRLNLPFENACVEIKPDDVAQILYTGGTTGTPKGAMLTHRNIISNVTQARNILGGLVEEGKETLLGVLPFFHSYGSTAVRDIGLLVLGAEIVLFPAFEPKKVIKAIEKHGITIFPGINKIYQLINDHPLSAKADMSSLKLCISGAGSIDKKICERFKELSGTAIVEGYGLSETSPVVSLTLPEDLAYGEKAGRKGNLIGRVLPETKVEIVGESGEILGPNEIGQIAVTGPQVMKGYYNRPEETAEVLRNGRLLTGDIGYLDENGYLWFTDREKDVIKRRGENIFASHIENALKSHPAISDAVVVGISSQSEGEIPVALVVLSDKKYHTPGLPQELKDRMKNELSHLHVPARIIFVESLEQFKNALGKVLRRLVKEYLKNERF